MEIMREIVKHRLDYKRTIDFILDQLEGGKTLSSEVLKSINFKLGNFFTFLPDNALIEKLYEFSYGGIIVPILMNGDESVQRVVTLGKEYSDFCWSFLQSNKNNCLLLEHVIAEASDPGLKLPNINLLTYNNEVYYLLRKDNSKQEIFYASKIAEEVWHFLALLCCIPFKQQQILDESDFKSFCYNARLVIVSAYDGEGYIFWERNKK